MIYCNWHCIHCVVSVAAKRACFTSAESWHIVHLYSERRVSYVNNMNVCAAETPIPNKPVLPCSSDRILLPLPLILDAVTAPSWL